MVRTWFARQITACTCLPWCALLPVNLSENITQKKGEIPRRPWNGQSSGCERRHWGLSGGMGWQLHRALPAFTC